MIGMGEGQEVVRLFIYQNINHNLQQLNNVSEPLQFNSLIMIERLHQLQKLNKHFIPFNTAPLSAQTLVYNQHRPDIEGIEPQFFKKIVHTKALIQRISQNNDTVQDLRVKYQKAIKTQQEKNCSAEIDRVMTENASIHEAVKRLIGEIKREVDDCERNEELKDQPETKMKRNLFHSVSTELAKTIGQQKAYEEDYKDTVKNKIRRQVKIIDKDLTDKEVQHYVQNPQEAQRMLQKKIYGQASTTLKNTVADIQDKFKDIQKLQHSVNQCLQMFKELSAMVYAQGEVIDSIEMNVNQAKDYVEKGEKQLVKAKEHHKCTKKCMCYLIIIAVVVLGVVLAIVIPTVLKK